MMHNLRIGFLKVKQHNARRGLHGEAPLRNGKGRVRATIAIDPENQEQI